MAPLRVVFDSNRNVLVLAVSPVPRAHQYAVQHVSLCELETDLKRVRGAMATRCSSLMSPTVMGVKRAPNMVGVGSGGGVVGGRKGQEVVVGREEEVDIASAPKTSESD
jgi:hypothetical protein